MEEENLDVGGTIILKWIFKKWDRRACLHWIDLVEDRDKWWG